MVTVTLALLLASQPDPIVTFAQLRTSLTNGRLVSAVIDYGKCAALSGDSEKKPGPAAIGGFHFKAWELFERGSVRNEKAFVSASETVLIAHPSYGQVLNYGKLRIYEDGSCEIVARYFKPTSYDLVMDQSFETRLSNGRDSHGVRLFAHR